LALRADTAELATLPAAARYGSEHSAIQVFDRLAGAWTYWGWKHQYFDGSMTLWPFSTNCVSCWRGNRGAQLPQWFNTGLHWPMASTAQQGPLLRRSRNQ